MTDVLKICAFIVAIVSLLGGVMSLQDGKWDVIVWQFGTMTFSLLYLFNPGE